MEWHFLQALDAQAPACLEGGREPGAAPGAGRWGLGRAWEVGDDANFW